MPWKDKFIAIILHYSHLHLVTLVTLYLVTPPSSLSLSPSLSLPISLPLTNQGMFREPGKKS